VTDKIVIATFVLCMAYAAGFVVLGIAWLRLHVELAQVRERLRKLTLDRQHAARMEATWTISNPRYLEARPTSDEAASGAETP
jgi:hypothetical protein